MIGGLTLEQRSTISEELSQSSSQLSVRTASLDIQENCHRFRHYPQRGGVWTRLAKKAGASVPTGIIRPPSLVGGRTVSVKLTPQERQPEKDKSTAGRPARSKLSTCSGPPQGLTQGPTQDPRVSARRQKPNHPVEQAAIVKTGVCVGANACFLNRQNEF